MPGKTVTGKQKTENRITNSDLEESYERKNLLENLTKQTSICGTRQVWIGYAGVPGSGTVTGEVQARGNGKWYSIRTLREVHFWDEGGRRRLQLNCWVLRSLGKGSVTYSSDSESSCLWKGRQPAAKQSINCGDDCGGRTCSGAIRQPSRKDMEGSNRAVAVRRDGIRPREQKLQRKNFRSCENKKGLKFTARMSPRFAQKAPLKLSPSPDLLTQRFLASVW